MRSSNESRGILKKFFNDRMLSYLYPSYRLFGYSFIRLFVCSVVRLCVSNFSFICVRLFGYSCSFIRLFVAAVHLGVVLTVHVKGLSQR